MTTDNDDNDDNNDNMTTHNNDTGVCKINGVVIGVSCCYSMVFQQQTTTKTPFFFANTGKNNSQP